MFILYIYKLKRKSLILIVFLIIIIPTNLFISSLNQKYYGANTNNEIINSNFSKAYQNLMKIKPDKDIYRVSIPKRCLYKAMEVSPTLESLKKLINENYKENPDVENSELIDGYMIWSLRRIASNKGVYKSFKTSEEFWGKVNKELEKTFQENKLEKRFTIPSSYISPPTLYNLKTFIKTIPKTIKYVLTYEDFITYDYNTLKNSNKSYITKADISKINYYPYYSLIIKTSNTNDLGNMTYKGVGGIFNIITFIYQKLSLIINLLGVICFIILLFSKNKKIIIPVLTLLTTTLLICGITYTDATSFKAIRYFYLAPVYITLIIFSITSIFILWEDIQNGKIRTNYLVTMFKRRKNIPNCLAKALKFLTENNINGEILLADNGSTDSSKKIAKSLNVRVIDVKEKGYGNALREGIKKANGKHIIMADSDDSYDLSNIFKFYEALKEGDDFVIGNRFKGKLEKGSMPFLNKYVGNPILSYIPKKIFKTPNYDYHCGLRGGSKQKLINLNLESEGMELASEMLIKAFLKKYKIKEINISYYKSKYSRKSHLKPFRDSIRHLKKIFELKKL